MTARLILTTYQSPEVQQAESTFKQAAQLNAAVSAEVISRADYFAQWAMVESNMRELQGVAI